MAAATVALLQADTFRPPGVDAHFAIPYAVQDQKVEGEYDLEMLMFDGCVSVTSFSVLFG